MADTSKGVTEVQALTLEELAILEGELTHKDGYNIIHLHHEILQRLLFTICQCDKRIEELEAQLKELTSDVDEKFEDK